ncbi:MAG: cytochrome c3 family protein [Candidatus Polarisedimenticolaceae bacterium]|nr:cytochrome c3 family protein [Candidatus Polarisedimenticolaceae bacterium]
MMRALVAMVFGMLVCSAAGAEDQVPDDIKMDGKIKSMQKAGVGPVSYPHKLHSAWYECSECHPKVFAEKIGANDINMNKIISDEFCGSSGCHNSAYAFPLYLCENCHEITESPKKK